VPMRSLFCRKKNPHPCPAGLTALIPVSPILRLSLRPWTVSFRLAYRQLALLQFNRSLRSVSRRIYHIRKREFHAKRLLGKVLPLPPRTSVHSRNRGRWADQTATPHRKRVFPRSRSKELVRDFVLSPRHSFL